MAASELLGGRYQITGIIRHGGMATVHDGWDTRLARPVAIKVLHPAFGRDAGHRARFEFEARSAAALNHPNIVVVHDFGEERGQAYLIMERLPGQSLVDTLVRGPLPPDRVRSVLADVLAGLGAAHATGILHRDIKPGNIVFDPAGTAKIADFGIAKTGGTDLTQAGEMVGTMAYLSPDRIAGRPATTLDDLYAVGAVGYEALTGRMPYPQPDPASLVRAIAEHHLAPLRVVRPDVDPVLAGVIDRAMAPVASHRFADAESMRATLLSMRPPTRVMAAPPVAAGWPPPLARRRKMLGLAAIAAIILLALILGIAWATSSGSDSAPESTSPPTTADSTAIITTTDPTSATFMPDSPDGPGNGNGKPRGRKHEGEWRLVPRP